MSKKYKSYYAISVAITASFVLLGIFVFSKSYLRLGEAFADLWNSAKYYFCEIFGVEHATVPTVEFYSKIIKWDILLPTDFENFKTDFVQYFTLLFSKDNFVMWGMSTSKVLENIGKIMVIVLPCLLVLWFSIKKLYNKPNTNYNQDTLPLKVYKSIQKDSSKLSCYSGEVHGGVDLRRSFVKSCNTSFANIGLSLNGDHFADTCKQLLFNQNLPVEKLDTSKSSFVLNGKSSTSEIMETSIGQGKTLVTPLHMLMITSAVANNGVLMKPHVIDFTENHDGGTVKTYAPSSYGNLMTEEEAAILQDYMKETADSGTASKLSGLVAPGYRFT